MNKSNKLVFFGNERLATAVTTNNPVLRSLIEAGYEISAIVANNERAQSRKSRDLEIQEIAEANNIELLLPNRPKEILDKLSNLGSEVAVLVAYGKIVPQEIIDIFPKGIINIHPSLLPKHRGPTPIESVILDGSTKTGVSVMSLTKDMDAGPVYAQQEVSLSGHESKQELCNKLSDIGARLLLSTLPKVLDGSLKAMEQNDNLATYDNLIQKSDGNINWTKPAKTIEREVRAYKGWPGSHTVINGQSVIITKASVVAGIGKPGDVNRLSKSTFGIYCGQDTLEVIKIKPAGKAEMSASGFLAGYSV